MSLHKLSNSIPRVTQLDAEGWRYPSSHLVRITALSLLCSQWSQRSPAMVLDHQLPEKVRVVCRVASLLIAVGGCSI